LASDVSVHHGRSRSCFRLGQWLSNSTWTAQRISQRQRTFANLPLCMRGTVDAFEKGPVQVRCEHNAVLSHSLHRPAKRAVCRCWRPTELKRKEWQVLPPVCRVVVIEVCVVLHKLCENVAGSDLASNSLQAARQGAALPGAGQRCLCLACSPSSHRPCELSLDNRGSRAGQTEHWYRNHLIWLGFGHFPRQDRMLTLA